MPPTTPQENLNKSAARQCLVAADKFIKESHFTEARKEIERAKTLDPSNVYITAFIDRITHFEKEKKVETGSVSKPIAHVSIPKPIEPQRSAIDQSQIAPTKASSSITERVVKSVPTPQPVPPSQPVTLPKAVAPPQPVPPSQPVTSPKAVPPPQPVIPPPPVVQAKKTSVSSQVTEVQPVPVAQPQNVTPSIVEKPPVITP
ncbi:MAG: hypothetical protein PHP42_06545, partial [Bacteroidota bacterium]|nr:hypothetical protein [Bacteroidota bacterium]